MTSRRPLFTLALLAGLAAPAAGQGFGAAVATGPGGVLVGEPSPIGAPGRIYHFTRGANGRWVESARVSATDGAVGDRFGSSLAAADDRMLVGAPAADSGLGLVYVFERRGNRWTQVARLAAPARARGDDFGASLAVTGDVALIGAPGATDGTGIVHVFRRSGQGAWVAAGTITPGDSSSGQRFGTSIARAGARVLVGAPRLQGFTGAVYAYDLDAAGAATARGRLTSRIATRNSAFGQSVAVRGNTAMVGAPRRETFEGGVATFEFDSAAGAWRERGQLLAFDGGRGQFGAAIAFDDASALIAAPTGGNRQGRVYAVTRDTATGEWMGAAKVGIDINGQGGPGGGIAFADGRAIVGSPGADFGLGATLVLERNAAGDWQTLQRITGADGGYAALGGRERRCDGGKVEAFECSEVDLASFIPLKDLLGARGAELSGNWGWTDPETGAEIAIIGRMDGTTFIDVTSAERPVVLGNLPRTEGARASNWRELKTSATHLYIVSDGSGDHGMQIFDLRRLRNRRGSAQVYTPDATYRGVASAHNIAVNEETGFAYITGANGGGETCGGGLHMVDIRDPVNPKFVGCFQDPRTGRAGTGYSHDVQCVVYHGPDPDHQGREICIGANETAISIADVTDKAAPKALSTATYPNVGYAHQGWFTTDQRYWVMNDELDEVSGTLPGTRTIFWDFSDLDDPVMLREFYGTTRATDHNLYVKGNRVYQSNYVAGLRVLDITDIRNPKEIGYFDTVPNSPNEPGFDGSWNNYPFFRSGTIVVSSGREGVFFVRDRETPVP